MRRNGKRVAGTLDSVSSCPCGARLIPSVLTATYEKREAEPPASQRVAQPDEATVNGNPVTPRQRLMNQLDAHLLNSTRLRGQTTLGDHPKLKTALGISSRSLVHHWDKAGGPGQIPGYAAHVEAISRATKYMKAGGYIGIGLGGVSSLLAIQQVCNGDSGAACERVKFTEGGKFAGATLGGIWGGVTGQIAGGPICLGIGVATGGLGGVVCVAALVGAGAWAGTTFGEMGGDYIGEKIYEASQP